MTMHSELQIDAVANIPENHRFLQVDASGGLVKITKHMNRNYNKVLNYVCLLKNLGDLDQPGVVINESATSRHDTTRIAEIFDLFKSNYEKKTGNTLIFRIIGMDLSWATIYAALKVFNLETINDYSKRIFDYASNTTNDNLKSFLASCCSHTMHRFTRNLKKQVKFNEKEHRIFAVLCFFLLLNCINLDSSKEIFKLM